MDRFGDLFGEDQTTANDGDLPGFALPVTAAEIDELLYSEEWSAEERIARLRTLREHLAAAESSDFGDDDPAILIGQIDAAVAQLSGEDEETEPSGADIDPADHRETLSPDSDELAAIEEEDEASLSEDDEDADDDDDGPLDDNEWVDGDGFDPDKGVR